MKFVKLVVKVVLIVAMLYCFVSLAMRAGNLKAMAQTPREYYHVYWWNTSPYADTTYRQIDHIATSSPSLAADTITYSYYIPQKKYSDRTIALRGGCAYITKLTDEEIKAMNLPK